MHRDAPTTVRAPEDDLFGQTANDTTAACTPRCHIARCTDASTSASVQKKQSSQICTGARRSRKQGRLVCFDRRGRIRKNDRRCESRYLIQNLETHLINFSHVCTLPNRG